MALFVEVRNTNPLGAVSLTVDGDRVEVAKGGVLKVSPEVAGVGPSWRPVGKDDTPQFLQFHETRTKGDGDKAVVEVHDLGYGLLAQPENWVLVEEKPASKNTKENV